MLKVLTISDISKIIAKEGLDNFFNLLADRITHDFKNWDTFGKNPRTAYYSPKGVAELMHIADQKTFSCKYVNGHPYNPLQNRLNVIGMGFMSQMETGYLEMISEMTLLTGLRTGATSALASKLLARKDSKIFGIIGCGSQSEFQVLAHKAVMGLKTIKYYDIDPKAMEKFQKNLEKYDLELIACESVDEVVKDSEIVTTATADIKFAQVLNVSHLREGLHINAMGGDSEEKSELDPEILAKSKIVVELFEQTKKEGEIKQIPNVTKDYIYAELWEIISGQKNARENDSEITLFDSVGFALEDFSTLNVVKDLSEKYDLGTEMNMLPILENPKDLFSLV